MTSLINEPNTDFHLKLNEQLFHIPYILLQRNFKYYNELLEKESLLLNKRFKELDSIMSINDLENDKIALTKVNYIVKSIDTFEKKIKQNIEIELEILNRIKYRIKFFKDLDLAKIDGSKNDLIDWYQKYTNLLIGDYLTRNSSLQPPISRLDETDTTEQWNPGVSFLKQQNLENLLDYNILLNANKISKSLTELHDLSFLIEWIDENKLHLRKNKSKLEFKTKFQEYVEVLKAGNYELAIRCFQNNLMKYIDIYHKDIITASGLIVFIETCQGFIEFGKEQFDNVDNNDSNNENTLSFEDKLPLFVDNEYEAYLYFFDRPVPQHRVNPASVALDSRNKYFERNNLRQYMALLDEKNWNVLNELFLDEYYSLYGISKNEPLLIYLSLGISTLKTRGCLHHDNKVPKLRNAIDNDIGQLGFKNSCPVCSEGFAPISTDLPFAHHTESKLFDNPVMLPNGNVYDVNRLKQLKETLKKKEMIDLAPDQYIDPIDQQPYSESEFIKMYPT